MMVRPEVQSEIDATRDAMAALRQAVEGKVKMQRKFLKTGPDGHTPAERLKAFRAERELSQRDLASKIGYAQSYIGNIEAGRTQPSREFARKMAEVFGLSADWLLFGRGAA